jgi:predicted nucleic acid-binding protein
MKNSYVFDTGLFYLYFAGEKRATDLFEEVSRGSAAGHTVELNLAEFYYKTCERLGRDTALLRYTSLRHGPLSVASPDEILTRIAGDLKCSHESQLSLADAYVIALTRQVRGQLYTTDPRIGSLKVVPTHLIELPQQA